MNEELNGVLREIGARNSGKFWTDGKKQTIAEIKDSENINQFRKRLKTYLFGKSYYMNQKTINEQYKV